MAEERGVEPLTFLLSGFLIVGGFFFICVVSVVMDARWQPLFILPALISIGVGIHTYIIEWLAYREAGNQGRGE